MTFLGILFKNPNCNCLRIFWRENAAICLNKMPTLISLCWRPPAINQTRVEGNVICLTIYCGLLFFQFGICLLLYFCLLYFVFVVYFVYFVILFCNVISLRIYFGLLFFLILYLSTFAFLYFLFLLVYILYFCFVM